MTRTVSKLALISVVLVVLLSLAACSRTAPPPSTSGELPTLPDEPTSVPSEGPGISQQVCILTAFSGDVTVQPTGSVAWIGAEVGMELEGGDFISTGADSWALITFFEGSTMELQDNTKVSIEELSVTLQTGSTTISLTQTMGKTMNRVEKLTDPASRYEVTTPSGVALVRGTEYAIDVSPDGTVTVMVTEGSVTVAAQGVEVVANAGEQTTISPGLPPSPPIPIPPAPPSRSPGGTSHSTGGGGSKSLPQADFKAEPTFGIAPLTVQFTDLSEGRITARVWDFGDDVLSTDQNPAHIYSVPGSYNVSLTAYNSAGSDTETKNSYITVYSPGSGNSTVIIGNIAPP